MKTTMFAQAVALLAMFCARSVFAAEPSITQEELVRRTQELFDAVVPGNKEPWQKYYADDCMFFDEKGRNMDKAALRMSRLYRKDIPARSRS